MLRRVALADCCALALLAACQPAASGRAPALPSAGPPIDLASVTARARSAFHPDGAGGHEAMVPGLRVKVAADGTLLLAPQDPARPVSAALRLGPARLGPGVDGGAPPPAEVERGGALLRRRGAVEERLAAGPRDAALSWTFPARPAGDGDLVVRLPVAGLPLLAATASGLHFAAPGAPGIRVGHATWIDAAGRATPLPARHGDGEVVIAVPAALLEGSTYPAVLDPLLSPESELDVPVLAAAPGAQGAPAVASDGAGWLVAWTDARAANETWVVATRVAADGTVLDPTGLLLATGPGQRAAPAVAFGAGAYLVAWQQPASTGGSGIGAALGVVRVGSDGTRQAGPPIQADLATGPPGRSAVAFDGTSFRVAWSTFRDATAPGDRACTVRLATLDGAGQPVASAQLGAGGCTVAIRPGLACQGEACLVARRSGGALLLGLFDRALGLLAGATLLDGTQASVAFTGSEYLVAYERPGPSIDSSEVAGVRLDAAGALVADPFVISSGGRSASPSLALDGGTLLVAWEERRPGGADVLARRLGLDGTPLGDLALPIATAAGPQAEPAVATATGGALVAFTDARLDPAGDLRAARVLPGGLLPDGDGLLLSRGAASQRLPAVAFDGTRWLVVFEGGRDAGLPTGVYGLRLGGGLAPGDAAPFLITTGSGAALRPSAAGCDGGFLVAWEDYTFGSADVVVAAVPGSGPPSAAVAVASGPGAQTMPAVACGPAGALVSWHDAGWYPDRPVAARAARLAMDGAALDAGGLVIGEGALALPAAVAAGPAGFAVAWQETDLAGHSTLLAAALGAAGGPTAPVVACDGPGGRGGPALSADATGYQLTFTDLRSGAARLRSARLSAGGALADPCGVELPGAGGVDVAAAFDGARHLLAYQRPGTGPVVAAQLTPGGGALGELEVTTAGDAQRAPAVACDGRGACLLATERPDAAAGAIRVRVRLVTSDPPVPACAGPADCGGGFCVDGVCCDAACGGGDPGDCLACSVAAGAPADGTCAPAAPGRLCRGGTACDAAERCDGTAAACPADAVAPEGGFCDDGDACTTVDACHAGACLGAQPVACPSSDQCLSAACVPATGRCELRDRPVGSPCDDGNACTEDDRCAGGVRSCLGAPKVCPAPACQLATCDQRTGACGRAPAPDGSSCDDGSACTVEDHCLGGACLAGPAVRCPPPDACHQAGLCDRATGACVYAERPDGTACDDADACTRADGCLAGRCVGADPVTCPGAGACLDAGRCDPATGACGRPVAKPDGTACDDGNACTRADGCRAGACVGGDPVGCPAATACAEAAICDPATGQCAAAWRPAGTACDDGDACTAGDACAGGTCRPGTAPACPPSTDACQVATCASATGSCGTAPAPDGAACPGGHCQAGACQPARASGGCASGGGAGWLALLATAALGLSRPGRRRAVRPSASTP